MGKKTKKVGRESLYVGLFGNKFAWMQSMWAFVNDSWWSRLTRSSNLICIHVAVKFRSFQLGEKDFWEKENDVDVLKEKNLRRSSWSARRWPEDGPKNVSDVNWRTATLIKSRNLKGDLMLQNYPVTIHSNRELCKICSKKRFLPHRE